jgi:hypothetical protein
LAVSVSAEPPVAEAVDTEASASLTVQADEEIPAEGGAAVVERVDVSVLPDVSTPEATLLERPRYRC